MDDYRRYRQSNEKEDKAKNELFSGATNNQYNSGGYPRDGYPPPNSQSQYPGPGYSSPYGQQQETEDVEGIKTQIRATKIDSLNSTQRSLQMINDAEVSAQSTLNKLGEQTQRINYTDRQLDIADAYAEKAAEQASKLKKVNGSMFGFDISNPFTKKKREAAELARVQAMQEEQRNSRENMRSGNWESKQRINDAMKQSSQQTHQPRGTTSSNKSRFQFEADDDDEEIENQLDRNLDSLSSGLTRLNAMAIASGEEVKRQNEVLDRISDKTTGLDTRIVGTTHTLKKIN